ncbi:hypothetical protein WKW79_30045 [Variovorax robiniae]|uniref:Uncharacterized protein n=1 Tax=Variovorax robiniae TaxID=1836199 RepID=A0ABU8XIG3_9BURK
MDAALLRANIAIVDFAYGLAKPALNMAEAIVNSACLPDAARLMTQESI